MTPVPRDLRTALLTAVGAACLALFAVVPGAVLAQLAAAGALEAPFGLPDPRDPLHTLDHGILLLWPLCVSALVGGVLELWPVLGPHLTWAGIWRAPRHDASLGAMIRGLAPRLLAFRLRLAAGMLLAVGLAGYAFAAPPLAAIGRASGQPVPTWLLSTLLSPWGWGLAAAQLLAAMLLLIPFTTAQPHLEARFVELRQWRDPDGPLHWTWESVVLGWVGAALVGVAALLPDRSWTGPEQAAVGLAALLALGGGAALGVRGTGTRRQRVRAGVEAALAALASTAGLVVLVFLGVRLLFGLTGVSTEPAVITLRDLPAGHVLAAQDLALAEVPSITVLTGALPDPSEWVGMRLREPALAGEPLRAERLDARVAGPAPGERWVRLPGPAPDEVGAAVTLVDPQCRRLSGRVAGSEVRADAFGRDAVVAYTVAFPVAALDGAWLAALAAERVVPLGEGPCP